MIVYYKTVTESKPSQEKVDATEENIEGIKGDPFNAEIEAKVMQNQKNYY